MAVSDDLQEECNSAMLHDNMKISRLIVNSKNVEEARVKSKVEMLRGQDLLMEVLERIGFKYHTSL